MARKRVDSQRWDALGDSKRWDLLVILLLGGHLVWVFSHFLPISVGPDAGGILVQARLMATEFTTGFRPDSPLQFLGSHWLETHDGDFHSRYPPGLSAVLAVLFLMGGARAPFFLNPVLATAVVGLTYLVGRRFLGRGLAFWAATMAALLPILNRLALHGDAHPAAAALLLLGVLLLLRWEDQPSVSRALASGLALGCLPMVRYPEAVVGVVVVVFLLLHRRRGQDGFFPAAAGAAIPIVILLVYNALTYGSPWRTGYGYTNEQFAFSPGNLATNLPTYLHALATGEAGLWFILGSVGLGWMVARSASRRRGILLGGIVLSLTLLYAAYYWGAQEESDLILRYFLATLPLLILGTAWLAKTLPLRKVSGAGLTLASAVYVAGALPGSSDALLEEWVGNARGQAVATTALDVIPEGSVVIARREIQDMLDYFGRWRLIDDRMLPGTPARAEATLVWELPPEVRAGLEGVPTPVQVTKAVAARSRYVGLRDHALASLVLEDIAAWNGGVTRAYWLGKPSTLEAFAEIAGPSVRIEALGSIDLPGWGGGTILPAWVPKAPLVLFLIDMQS